MRKNLDAAEKLRIAKQRQAADCHNWLNWRGAGKEPDLAKAKELLLFGLGKYEAPEDVKQITVSRIKLDPSGKLDECTSFILWDMIENASQSIVNPTRERYGDTSAFSINKLYAITQKYISSRTPPKTNSASA